MASSSRLLSSVTVLCALLALLQLICPVAAQPVSVVITTPRSNEIVGVAGAGWLIDLEIEAADLSGNSIITPPDFTGFFHNGLNKSTFHPGVLAQGTGLVVLLSTTPNNNGTLLGPSTNLAGLFQIAGTAVDPTNLNYYRALWFLGSAAFGLGVPINLTAFVVSGTAPALLPSDPTTTPNIVSNIATVSFHTSGLVSDSAATSVFNGPSPADPAALEVIIFSPEPDLVVGVNGANWAVDTLAAANSPQFNPLLSAGAGYSPLFNNGTNPAISRPGFHTTAPGLVVLINTTQVVPAKGLQGPATNLAGLFQMMGLLEADVGNGTFLNVIWPTWLVGAALFGSGPSQVSVFYLNTTAPLLFTDEPTTAPGLISNVAIVEFFITANAAASGGTVLGDPSFSGFHGQPSYQVHGIPGEVFNVLTAASLQLNALFAFIDRGEALTSAEMVQAREQQAELPLTQPWSHPGTYLSQVGLKLGNISLFLQAGRYSEGILSARLLSGEELLVGQTIRDGRRTVTLASSHSVKVRHELVSFTVVNSDGFFNIEDAQLLSTAAFHKMDGLLGQSADPSWMAGKGEEFEAHMTMDYWVSSADSIIDTLFSSEFRATKSE